MKMLNDIINGCIATGKSRREYFDELDQQIKNNDVVLRLIFDLSRCSAYDTIILTGEFGRNFFIANKDNFPHSQGQILYSGGLSKGETPEIIYQKDSKFNGYGLILDDSCYSYTTINSLKKDAQQYMNSTIRDVYVVYDGGIETPDGLILKSFYTKFSKR